MARIIYIYDMPSRIKWFPEVKKKKVLKQFEKRLGIIKQN